MYFSDKMKAFFSLLLTFGAIFVCNFTTAAAYDDSQTTALYPYLIFEPAIESIDNLYRAILGLYRSCIIALRKFFSEKLQESRNGNSPPTNSVGFGGLYKFQLWREQNNHYVGTLQEMIFYMQREVNEAESNLQIIIKYFNGLADGTIPPPEELAPRTVQIIITIWVELQDSINRLSYDIDVFRSYVTAKIDSLKNRYGEGTLELHEGMKIICHEVDTRSLYWIKIVGSAFRKALAVPQASYYIVNLETFYAEWQTLFALPPEVTVVEILIQCRALANTIHNAAQAHFFLSVSMRLKVNTWPYLNLIFQDFSNIKRFVDRGFTRIESFIRGSLNRIQEELQAENYDQADLEMQTVREQVESDVKVIIDFTETSYRRIYDALYADYFDIYATDLRYTDALQNLSWFLADQGFAISWPENEFAPINERIMVVNLSETNYPGVTQYSKNNFRSIANVNNAGNDYRYLKMSLNAYHLILHENLLLNIISIYQTVLNDLRNTLPQNNASKVILLNLREDAILFAQGFQYLRLYVSQSGLFIDWVPVQTVEEYINLLMKLDLDVLHRIDILCYRAMSTFKRALDYSYFVNSSLQPPTGVAPQEEIPVQNTEITPREFTGLPPAENPAMGQIRSNINAPPSFWMGRRLLNRHGKLPYYIRPSGVTFGTPAIIPGIGAEELPGQYIPNEGVVDGILPDSGVEFPSNMLQIITRRIPNDVNVGKKRPILQRSVYRSTPTQLGIQNPNTTGNEIVPEIIVEIPPFIESIPSVEPTVPTQLHVPSARFLNEWPFGKRVRILPHAYQPTIINPLLVSNPTDAVLDENIINTAEPILPTNTVTNNSNQGSFSSPRSLNERLFGKRKGIPTSFPQTLTNSPAIINPLEISQNNGENIAEVTPPVEEFTPPLTVVSSSAGGMNGEHFGKIDVVPNSLPQATTNSPPIVIPNQIPVVDNTAGVLEREWIPETDNVNGIPEDYITPTINEFNSIPEEQLIEPPVGNISEIPEEEFTPPPTVVSPSAGGMNGEHFGKIDVIPESLPQVTTNSPSVVIPDQIPVVDDTAGALEGEWIHGTDNINEIPEDYVSPTINEFNSIPEEQLIEPPVSNINGIPEEEFTPPPTVVSPSAGGMNGEHFGKIENIPGTLSQATTNSPAVVIPDQIPVIDNTAGALEGEWIPETNNVNEIPQEEYVSPAVNEFIPLQEGEFVQPTTENTNTELNGELTVANPNPIQNEEFVLPTFDNEIPEDEHKPLFQSGNTKPNQEEIAAALDLLSTIYEPLDMNNDGAADILIINPQEANAGLFGGNGKPGNINGDTTVVLNQNTEGWKMNESTLEGTGYFDELGILHDGNITGTQHGEAEINSNSLGLVDFNSDGGIDMAVENSTNQILNEDNNIIVLGDLNSEDGIRTNTVIRTSLTTQEETSVTTYVLGDEEQPLLQNTQQQ